MKVTWATILLVLLSSASALGHQFEVSDLSGADSPVSFTGTAKVGPMAKDGETETFCVVTMRNNSSQSLLAIEVSGEVTDPWGGMQPTSFSYDGFFRKKSWITPGDYIDLPPAFTQITQVIRFINGVPIKQELKNEEPKKYLVCHAELKVHFFQLEDGSSAGDYQTQKEVMARRDKQMAVLSHLAEAYDTGGDTALAAALEEPESRPIALNLKNMAKRRKISPIDLVRTQLALAQERQASGIF